MEISFFILYKFWFFFAKVQSLIFFFHYFFQYLLLTVKLEINLYFLYYFVVARRFDFCNRLNRLSVVYWARVISDYNENSPSHQCIHSAFFVFLCLLSHLFIPKAFFIFKAAIYKHSYQHSTLLRKYLNAIAKITITFGFYETVCLMTSMECIIIIFTYHFSSEGEKLLTHRLSLMSALEK